MLERVAIVGIGYTPLRSMSPKSARVPWPASATFRRCPKDRQDTVQTHTIAFGLALEWNRVYLVRNESSSGCFADQKLVSYSDV